VALRVDYHGVITVRELVDRVGPTLLRTALGVEPEPGQVGSVTDVVIAEAGRDTPIGDGDLVLGVSAGTEAEATALVGFAGTHGAAAVLLKPPLASSAAVAARARQTGTALVEVHGSASWAQLVWLLRTVLDAAADEQDAISAGPEGAGLSDLFRLADVAASVVHAPVTIEDANSRVLAYSARQDLTDPARVSTIMGRKVPDDVLARFRSRGVFRELSRGRTAIFVPAQPDGTLPRLIVPIRMGGELLGSMWAVVPGPVPDERAAAFAGAAPVVALHLLRRRATSDEQRRRSAELVRSVLDGRTSVRLAAAGLDLDDEPHRVVAIDVDTEDALDAEGTRLALWERLMAGVGRRPAVAEMHDVLYAIVPDRAGAGGWPELRAAMLRYAEGPRPDRALVAAGPAAALADLAGSRVSAEEVLGLLRAGLLTGPVASHDEVWPVVILHRLAVSAGGTEIAGLGPLPALRAHDTEAGTSYVDTLYEWLRRPGDPKSASAALRIHPNTLRYRMNRIAELTGIDLEDPDTRMALLVQLVTTRWS
jgi:hypothetical protein